MRQTQEPHFWSFAGTASKLYDYIQRNVWQTNKAFANFYYHSAVGDVLRQMGRCDEIRVSTDLLMVNPNKGFKWHQDNQNGPIIPEEVRPTVCHRSIYDTRGYTANFDDDA